MAENTRNKPIDYLYRKPEKVGKVNWSKMLRLEREARMNSRRRRDKFDRAYDKQQIALYKRMGYTIADICVTMGLTRDQVLADLKDLREDYQHEQMKDRHLEVLNNLLALRDVRRLAYQAWLETQKLLKTEMVEESTGSDGKTTNKRRVTTTKASGREFLSTILDTLKAERELLGLNEAVKLDITSDNTLTVDWSAMMNPPAVNKAKLLEEKINTLGMEEVLKEEMREVEAAETRKIKEIKQRAIEDPILKPRTKK